MNGQGKFIKKLADILAVVLIVMIFGGILGSTGLLTGILPADGNESFFEVMSFTAEEISSLDIEAGSADISFLAGEALTVEFDKSSFSVSERGGKITVKEKSNLLDPNKNRTLKIFLPESFIFEKVKLEAGASAIEGKLLRSQELELDAGAGVVLFEKLVITRKAEIDCGAGEITVYSGIIHSLDFSLGVGKADITAALRDKCEIESGVGSLLLRITDGKEGYSFDIETGLGSIVFDGSPVRGETSIGNGENSVKLEGGVGSVEISFV